MNQLLNTKRLSVIKNCPGGQETVNIIKAIINNGMKKASFDDCKKQLFIIHLKNIVSFLNTLKTCRVASQSFTKM